MKKHLSLFAAAALAVAAFAIVPARAQQDDAHKPGVGEKVGNAVDNAADKTGEAAKKAVDKTGQAVGLEASDDPAKNVGGIREVVVEVTEASLTKSGLDDIVERFSSADRDRLNQNKDALTNNSALDGRIEQFQKDWKAKYNQDFKIPDRDAIYTPDFAMITQGAEARTAGAQFPADAAKPAGDKAKEARNYAAIRIAASHGKPAVTVPIVHEARGWKIDVPDTVDANKLRDNVQAALTKCDEMKDQWPADVNEAYRGVSHGLLIAIMDQPMDEKAQPAAGQFPADQGTAPAAPAAPAAPGSK